MYPSYLGGKIGPHHPCKARHCPASLWDLALQYLELTRLSQELVLCVDYQHKEHGEWRGALPDALDTTPSDPGPHSITLMCCSSKVGWRPTCGNPGWTLPNWSTSKRCASHGMHMSSLTIKWGSLGMWRYLAVHGTIVKLSWMQRFFVNTCWFNSTRIDLLVGPQGPVLVCLV